MQTPCKLHSRVFRCNCHQNRSI